MKILLVILAFCAIAGNAQQLSYGDWSEGHWGSKEVTYQIQYKFDGFGS